MTNIQTTDDQVLRQSASSACIRPARIVEIREETLTPSYSWYTSWTTGCDSIYALLSKFALLNCLAAREIANLFVSSTCGRKSLLVQQLNLDLREPGVFDLSKIARLCHTTEQSVIGAFIRGRYSDNLVEASAELRYCAQCLERGFHSALFQLSFVPRCPIHHSALKQQCGRCAGIIPYRLSPSLLRKPFVCPHCDWQFAPTLREGPKQELRLAAESRAKLEHASEIACAKSQLFGSAQLLDRHFSFFGRGRLVLSAPSIQRSKEEYYEFIDAIVHRLSTGLRGSLPEGVGSGAVEPLVPVIEIVRGLDLPRPRIQRWRLLDPSSRRLLTRTPEARSPAAAKNVRKSQRPLPAPADLSVANDAHNAGAPQNVMTDVPTFGWDGKLQAVYPIYQAIRRHIWRRLLSAHRSCVRSAAARMWWDVEGDRIARFCPAAEAFLRWRMFWEGFGVPADLFRNPRHPAYGLLAWLCDGAPICAEGWTGNGEQWLTHRVFAMQCVRNFYEWLSLCESRKNERPARWLRADVIGSCLTYWAASGNDTPRLPLRLFIDTSFHRPVTTPVQQCSTSHRAWHRHQLLSVVR